MIARLTRTFERNTAWVLLLGGLFILSFTAPIFLGFGFTSGLFEDQEDGSPDKFPSAIHITQPESYVSVPSAPGVNPVPGRDFLLTIWVKLTRMPMIGDRLVFLSKYDIETRDRSGYSLGLSREADSLRPILYWKAENSGGWYTFSDLPISPQRWFMLAVSLREGKLLGMHGLIPDLDGNYQVRLLGGYDVGEKLSSLPASSAPLQIGSLRADVKFKGFIGPIGVFSPLGLSKRLGGVLDDLARNPSEVPESIKSDWVSFWSPDGVSDLGSNALPISRQGLFKRQASK